METDACSVSLKECDDLEDCEVSIQKLRNALDWLAGASRLWSG